MSNVRRIDGPKPPSLTAIPEPSTDDMARRGILLAAIGVQADAQPRWAHTETDLLKVLSERLGDVWAAHNNAHTDIEGELQRLAGTALALMERLERERAR